jgi:hypothetical protein
VWLGRYAESEPEPEPVVEVDDQKSRRQDDCSLSEEHCLPRIDRNEACTDGSLGRGRKS